MGKKSVQKLRGALRTRLKNIQSVSSQLRAKLEEKPPIETLREQVARAKAELAEKRKANEKRREFMEEIEMRAA